MTRSFRGRRPRCEPQRSPEQTRHDPENSPTRHPSPCECASPTRTESTEGSPPDEHPLWLPRQQEYESICIWTQINRYVVVNQTVNSSSSRSRCSRCSLTRPGCASYSRCATGSCRSTIWRTSSTRPPPQSPSIWRSCGWGRMVTTRQEGQRVFYRLENEHASQLVSDAIFQAEHSLGGTPHHHQMNDGS